MSYRRNVVSNTAAERILLLVELSHSTWAAPLRYAEDITDWTVQIETAQLVTFTASGFDLSSPTVADTGGDERSLTVPDMDLELWGRLEDLIGVEEPVVVTVRHYLTSALSSPALVSLFALSAPSVDENRSVTFAAKTPDFVNRNAPINRFLWVNAPALRR